MAQGVVQRQREAAVRRARARRRARRQQIARRVMRVGVGTAAVGAAGYGATKLGGLEQAKARLVKPRQPGSEDSSTNADSSAART
jgi:hypothetical protein